MEEGSVAWYVQFGGRPSSMARNAASSLLSSIILNGMVFCGVTPCFSYLVSPPLRLSVRGERPSSSTAAAAAATPGTAWTLTNPRSFQ